MLVPTRMDFHSLINARAYRRGVEIGVAAGDYSAYLLLNSQLQWLGSVDNFKGRHAKYEKLAKQKLAAFGQRSMLLKLSSTQASLQFAEQSLDFVYIDARHDYRSIKSDLRNWLPTVKIGGMLAGHDYVNKPKTGVIRAVDEMMAKRNEELFLTDEEYPSWYFFKSR